MGFIETDDLINRNPLSIISESYDSNDELTLDNDVLNDDNWKTSDNDVIDNKAYENPSKKMNYQMSKERRMCYTNGNSFKVFVQLMKIVIFNKVIILKFWLFICHGKSYIFHNHHSFEKNIIFHVLLSSLKNQC